MIEMSENLVGIWYLRTTETQDWMAGVSEIVPDEQYGLVYRFRYYEDDKPFDSADRKVWTEYTISGTRAYAIASVRGLAQHLASVGASGSLYECLKDGDLAAFVKKFMELPLVYARLEKVDRKVE